MIAYELAESSALRIGEFPITISRKITSLPSQKSIGNNELYWTIKSFCKLSPQSKWQYSRLDNVHPQTNRTEHAFKIRAVPKNVNITFNVRNWRQQPCQVKKPCFFQNNNLPSNFAILSNIKLKPTSKCVLLPSVLHYYHPFELLL